MSDFSPRELDLIMQARRDERAEIVKIIEKFVRPTTLSDGEVISTVKVPANHLLSLIRARGEAADHELSGEFVDPTVLPE